ncbi:MAG: hypothetical protein M3Y91_00185 [Actinomycetota bacterium]|nr:hypothetical protein [Actinomycetota bacterium]
MRSPVLPADFYLRPTRRQYALRRLMILTLAIALFTAAGGTVYGISRIGSSGRHAQAGTAGGPSHSTAKPAAPLPPLSKEPGGGTTLFPSHRLVAYYGAPASPTLGVLGDAPPDVLWSRLAAAAAPFAVPKTAVVASYELIAYTAEAAPGPNGTYSAELAPSQLDEYLNVVHAHHGMLILDIQPGRSDLLADAQSLEPWLAHPDVGLALDPEWELQPGQRPSQQIGRTTAGEINQVSAWLQQLTVAHRLPQKLLIVHQFRASMVEAKPDVTSRPNLALAFNMDGFGAAENKLSVYQLLAGDPRWALGYKLFYSRDQPLQTPDQILALAPAPQIVEYE